MFRRLQTRMTVLYAALFGAVLLAVAATVVWAVGDQARRQGASALSAAGEVFDRLWDVRTERLRVGAALLSRDYGFRQALATGDAPTVGSAVDNLRSRLGVDLAFVADPDGRPLSARDPTARAAAAGMAEMLAAGGDARGVAVVGGRAYETVAAPVLAPDLKGWIVFAVRMDAGQMRALSRLSPIPLEAQVVRREGARWRTLEARPGAPSSVPVAGRAAVAPSPRGPVLALARPLQASSPGLEPALLLTYPLDAALAPFRTLLWLLAGVGLLGMLLVMAGGWALARSITRPVQQLSLAARRLQTDPGARVPLASRDELGELARGFNVMAGAIQERETRLVDAARTDPDTGLPNRAGLEERVAELARGGRVAVLSLGVERFARMRGALGFEMASDLMRELGRRLAADQPGWAVARSSADILTAAFPAADVDTARAAADAARRRLHEPQTLGEHLIDVRLTAGVSAGDEPTQLVREADLALDAARAAEIPLAVFDPAARRRAAESLGLMPALRRAVREDALTLVHQPKRSLRSGAVCGVESLVRWTHPQLGPQQPDVFIPLAEDTGDIRAVTEWVAERAVADQAELARDGVPLAFSINLSGRLVGDADITRRLVSLASRAAGPLCVEVTETAAIGCASAALATFARLREAGVSLSIDDYGSGLSSLAYLKQIAADELKLDRSLIRDTAASARDALLVRSTVDLAHALGMSVTAEGVEDETTLAVLAGLGCDTVQGWVFARAMPLEALRTFLQAQEAAEPAAARCA